MSNTQNRTTFSQAKGGDKDCLELAFEQLADKIKHDLKLDRIEKEFLILHLKERSEGKKKPGRHAIGIDTKFSVFFEMAKCIDAGDNKTNAAKKIAERFKKGKNRFIREPRGYLKIYNQLTEWGWPHPRPLNNK